VLRGMRWGGRGPCPGLRGPWTFRPGVSAWGSGFYNPGPRRTHGRRHRREAPSRPQTAARPSELTGPLLSHLQESCGEAGGGQVGGVARVDMRGGCWVGSGVLGRTARWPATGHSFDLVPVASSPRAAAEWTNSQRNGQPGQHAGAGRGAERHAGHRFCDARWDAERAAHSRDAGASGGRGGGRGSHRGGSVPGRERAAACLEDASKLGSEG
jgi:hypothetical protein